jgi:pimeloyl-ACP methyl ester carboxylesterase
MEPHLQRSTVEIRGQPLAFWKRAGERGGPQLLLLHGLGASSHIWEPLARVLPPTLELLALDFPGCGASPGRGPLGPSALAKLALDLASAAHLNHIDAVLGHSLGGAVALEVGLAAPERVGGLMIFNAAPSLPFLTRLGLRAPGVQKLLALPELAPRQQTAVRLFTQMYLRGIFGERRGVTDELVEGYARLAEVPGYHRNSAETLAAFARHGRTMAELTSLDMPASIVWGERDPLFPIAVAERLARAIPQAALHRLPRCGHCPPQECPEQVCTLLMELLSRVARAGAQFRKASGARIS